MKKSYREKKVSVLTRRGLDNDMECLFIYFSKDPKQSL